MHTGPIRPATKTHSKNRRDCRYYGLAFGVLCMLAVPVRAQTTTTVVASTTTSTTNCQQSSNCQPQFNLNAYGGKKITINQCETNKSQSPCAWADAVQVPTNPEAAPYFLACSLQTTSPIALCYYSGVPGAPYLTPRCTFSQKTNAAECYCYQISAGTSGQQGEGGPNPPYSYVELTSILNEDVYNDTFNQCVDTQGNITCLNLSDLNSGFPEAPVCTAIRNKTLFPGADLISDFSQISIPNIANAGFMPPGEMGSFPPQACPTGGGTNLYAACMTAPCKFTKKIDPATGFPLARCTCPTYDGPNQVGNAQIQGPPPYSCSPTPYVWSSAYVETTKTTTTMAPCRTPRCMLEMALHGPECRDEIVPTGITKKLDQAAGLVEEATSSGPKRARRLRRRAKNLLMLAVKAAKKATRGKKPKLTSGCATAIRGAADVVRGGLRP